MTPDRRTQLLKTGLLVAALVVAFLTPFNMEDLELEKLATVGTFALGAMGLAVLTGFSGQISVGHGAFMGIGAYTTAILVADRAAPWYLSIGVAAVVCFAAGALVGLPALRIRGPALALATLGLAVLFPAVIRKYDTVTGGSQGKNLFEYRFRAPGWTGLTDEQWVYYVVLAFLLAALLLMRNLVRSRVGRGLIAIRDNEVAAEVLGVNIAAYKVLAFGTSAMLAGLGGALAVAINPNVSPGDYDIQLSIRLLVMAVVGGIATIGGPLLGATVVFYVNEEIRDRVGDIIDQGEELAPVVFGAALILLMMLMPDGLIGGTRRIWRRLRPPAAMGPPGSDDLSSAAPAVAGPASVPDA